MASSVTESQPREPRALAPTSVHDPARSPPTLLTLLQEIRNMIYAQIPTTTSIYFHPDKTIIQSRHPFLAVNQQLRYEFCSERIKDEVTEITCFHKGVDHFRTWLLSPLPPGRGKPIRVTKLAFLVRHYRMEKDAHSWIKLSLGEAWSCDVEIEAGNTCLGARDAERNEMILRSVKTAIRNAARQREFHRNDFTFLYRLHRRIWLFADLTWSELLEYRMYSDIEDAPAWK